MAEALPFESVEALRDASRFDAAWDLWSSVRPASGLDADTIYDWYKLGGDLGRMAGSWPAAETAYKQALEAARELEDEQALADVAAALAAVWRAQSRFAEALELYDEAAEIYSEYDDAAG